MTSESTRLPDPALPRLELSVLKEMVGGDEEQFNQLSSLFVRMAHESFADLQRAFAAADRPAIARLTHSMKGSAGVIGAHRLMEFLGRFEGWAKGYNSEEPDQAALLAEISWVATAVEEGSRP